MSLESFFTAAQMAIAGFGHGLVPAGVARTLGVPDSDVVPLAGEGLNRPVRFVARKSMFARPLIQSFYQALCRYISRFDVFPSFSTPLSAVAVLREDPPAFRSGFDLHPSGSAHHAQTLLIPLSGGYRKTPVYQQGANVYRDTDVIVRALARSAGRWQLYAHGFAADRVAEWADTQLFRVPWR